MGVNKTVKILSGKYQGVRGVVEKINPDGWVLVVAEGLVDGKPLYLREWFDVEQVEVVNG